MRDYPKLAPHQLWTVVEECSDAVQIEGIFLKEMQYPAQVYEEILQQAGAFRLTAETYIDRGDVVDGRTNDEEELRTFDLKPEQIVVKDNAFYGILTLCVHKEKIKYVEYETECFGLLFADGTAVGVNYDEFHRNPGHWYMVTEYRLEKR